MPATNNTKAAVFAITASMTLAFIDNFVWLISKEGGLWQFQVIRTLFALPLFYFFIRLFGLSWRPKNSWKLLLRSLLVAGGLLVYFASLGMLSVAQAGAGLFSAPIWLLIFALVFFKTKTDFVSCIFIVTGFIGVLLILQPDPNRFSFISLLPLIAGALYALGMLVTRHWCEEESTVAVALGVFVSMGVLSLLLLIYFTFIHMSNMPTGFLTRGWTTPTSTFLILTLMQTTGSMVGISLIARAYQIGDPTFVTVFEYTFLIFAAAWAYLLWETKTDKLSLLGIALVIIAGGIVSFRKSRLASP